MKETSLELLLETATEPNFRAALSDIIEYLVDKRGEQWELPSAQRLFYAIAKVTNAWLLTKGSPLISITENAVDLTELIAIKLPYLKLGHGWILNPNEEEGDHQPFFYQLKSAMPLIDDELGGVIDLLEQGFDRYDTYGVPLFLADFVWWGWQAYLKNSGEVSFKVSQNVGLETLNFMLLRSVKEVISLEPQPLVIEHPDWVAKHRLMSGEFSVISQDLFLDGEPNKAIAFTLASQEDVVITDLVLERIPVCDPIVTYNCNPDYNYESPMGLVRAINDDEQGEFILDDTLLNDFSSNTGVNLVAETLDSFAVVFNVPEGEYTYSLAIFSGQTLIGRIIAN